MSKTHNGTSFEEKITKSVAIRDKANARMDSLEQRFISLVKTGNYGKKR